MERIRALQEKMSKSELRHFKTYMKAFLPRSYTKCIQLLRLLDLYPQLSQPELIERLYGDANNKSFFHLKNQVEEKMLESLCISASQSSKNPDHDDFPIFANIGLHFRLTAAMLLRSKGLRKYSEDLLDGCIHSANKLGLPEVKLLALVHARSISASEEAVCGTLRDEIDNTLQQLQADITGIGYLDEIRIRLPNPANPQLIANLEQFTQDLDSQLKRAYSPRAHYYYLLLKLILMEARQEPLETCKECLEEMIQVLESNWGLKSRNRWAMPYVRLSELENRSFNFDSAYTAAEKAMEILPPKRINFLVAGINKIYACMYQGSISEAESVYEQLIWVHRHQPNDVHSGWLFYLHAYFSYLAGKPQLALKRLAHASPLFQYKLDWNPIIRIFEIQLLIETEALDLADARIEALRKHRERYGLPTRLENAFKCLYQLSKDGYNFQHTEWETFMPLQELIQQVEWEPMGQEIFPFEYWIETHQNRYNFLPYCLHKFDREREGLHVEEEAKIR